MANKNSALVYESDLSDFDLRQHSLDIETPVRIEHETPIGRIRHVYKNGIPICRYMERTD
ncbi:hypothetical protein PB16LOC_01018 [Pectobacterium versatile]|nr:hypothetical protein PB16LOC_01018 [Pectobacterium versatile]